VERIVVLSFGAAASGSLKVVEELLLSGADINAYDGYRRTPLSAAVAHGHVKTVGMLTGHSASKEVPSKHWGSALHKAAYLGHFSIVEMLLTQEPQADLNAAGETHSNSWYYRSVLHNACFSGKLQIENMVLAKGADVNAAGGEYGHPIQAAVRSGNPDVVGLLVARGALINVSGGRHGSPLEAAAHCGFHGLLHILLNQGADVNFIGRRGYHEYFSESSDGIPSPGALVAAAKAGYPEIVSQLIRHTNRPKFHTWRRRLRQLKKQY
jgi:ankyrin repeat protein